MKTLWEKEKLLVQAISPFPTMFSPQSKTEILIFVTFNLSSANAFFLVWSKILSCGNGLKAPFVVSRNAQRGFFLGTVFDDRPITIAAFSDTLIEIQRPFDKRFKG